MLFCCFAGAYTWFYALKPEIEGNTNFLRTDMSPILVTVPLGGRQYVDVMMDGINTELVESNQLTVWRFNDGRLVRTRDHETGYVVSGSVMYMSNREVYRLYDTYYVSASSDNRYVDVACESLKANAAYTAACPEMNEENQITELPETELPMEYENSGTWKLPRDVTQVALSQSVDDMSYYKSGWYFNYNFRYQKHGDAVVDAATRVCAISHEPLDWWYDDGNVFIAKAGDEYACVKQDTYTSCYFISSNDLSYILLNI